MTTNYNVTINQQIKQQISHESVADLDVIPAGKNTVHLLFNNQSYHVELIEKDYNQKTYTLKVNGAIYTVQIANALDQLIEQMGLSTAKSKKINQIKAPMPGLILDISVKVGDTVRENDTLLILEAMKMENSITSPRDGVIKSVTVKKGAAVDKNQLLIEFE
jgi:biotin carboxyl carrier protein